MLLSAVELGLFTQLAAQPLDNAQLALALGNRSDRSPDFFDALVAMGFLNREGDGVAARYSNSALRTGLAQNESKGDESSIFRLFTRTRRGSSNCLSAMASLQIGNFVTLANRFDFSKHKTVLDVGGANAQLSRALAGRHPHLSLVSFDLPAVSPIARRKISHAGLVSRIEVVSGDFFVDAAVSG